jgi:hypothetical protein
MKTATKFAIAWLVLAALLALALGRINIPTYLRLAEHGERATATVIRLDCDNHGRAFYTFTVGSTNYSTSDVMWSSNCLSLHSGDAITIYYEVTDPTISRAIEPRLGIENEVIPISFACLMVPPVLIVVLAGWYRENRRNWFKETN